MKKTKTLTTLLNTAIGFGILGGCNAPVTKVESSEILHEDAAVVDIVYTPSRHGSGSGFGPTIDSGGNIGISFSDVSVDIPEKYAVVFKCQHGKFVVQGTNQYYRDLWERFTEGQEVDVTYREVFRNTYQDIDKDGKKDLIKRELIDYDFIDAQLKNR
ncbi:hypothetical protein HYV50_01875 [Candidatus Pacearchaeota archaeon]|nr:hypothetical protein [Candidatus Pacearchaeota archaeon]